MGMRAGIQRESHLSLWNCTGISFPIPPQPGSGMDPEFHGNGAWIYGCPIPVCRGKAEFGNRGIRWHLGKQQEWGMEKGSWQESRAAGSQPREFKERFPCLDSDV